MSAWTKDTDAKTDCWERELGNQVRGHITQYEGTDRYCWQAVRGEYRLADIVTGRDAAMAQADATLALPIEEFNALVSAELEENLRKIERQLLAINPTADILPGYHAGYEAGVADTRRRIAQAIELDAG